MSGRQNELLQRAFDFIESDQHDEARALLRGALDQNRDDVDAWWLFAHAVRDAETARLALDNVLRIDPRYPGAEELLRELEPQRLSGLEIGQPEPGFLPSNPDGFPAQEWSPAAKPAQRSRFRVLLTLLTAIVLLGFISIIVVRQFEGRTIPTQSPSLLLTNEPMIPAISDELLVAVRKSLGAYQMPDNGTSVVPTSLGRTLTVSICGAAGPELRSSLPGVLQALSETSEQVRSLADAIGVQFLNCSDQSPLLYIGAPIEDAIQFSEGQLDQKSFQATWQRLD